MKLSYTLHVLQLIVITLLLLKLAQMDGHLQQLMSDSSAAHPITTIEQGEGEITGVTQQPETIVTNGLIPPTLKQIQTMIRQELAILKQASPGNIRSDQFEYSDAQDLIDQEIQLQLVTEELDFYIGQGVISAQEMSNLQIEIAKLDSEGQKQMMRKLVGALNSGELEGQL